MYKSVRTPRSLVFLSLFFIVSPSASAETSTVKLDNDIQYQLINNAPSGDGPVSGTGDTYRISIDGGQTYGRVKQRDTTIRLQGYSFDPGMQDEIRPAVGDTYLVQLDIQPLAAFKRRIVAEGGRVVGFVPPQTYIVHAGAGTMKAVNDLPFVRWTGPYVPDYKTNASLRTVLKTDADTGPVRYVISLFSDSEADMDSVADEIERSGGTVVVRGLFMQAELTASQLSTVLEHDNVQFADRWAPPEGDMDVVRTVGGANFLEAQVANYTGLGVTGEVMDDAIWTPHQGYVTPVFHDEPYIADSHGTPVYGIVFGNGGGDAVARGMLPDGTGLFASYQAVADRPAHTLELVDANGEYRAVFQSNSWGNGRTTAYNTFSAEMDQIIFETDLLITQSQSNAGDQMSRPQAWAKNIVSVGGVRHYNTASFDDDAWSGSASIGPAADGRIKPDLAHFYDNVYTTSGGTETSHRQFGGTSAATPVTAGHFGLLFGMWADGIFTGDGTPGSGGDVFAARPHASTARALMINTARQYDFTGTDHDLTRVHQGWGLANVESLYTAAESNGWRLPLVVNEEHALEDQQVREYIVNVTGGTTAPWLKATLVYMDPPGNPAAAVATVNDLSLRVTAPDGTVYWGNAGLLEGNWSVAGGSPSTVDTVENVFVEQAAAGDWTIGVIGDRIVEDARTETAAIDADYALVLTCDGANRCVHQSQQTNFAPAVSVTSPSVGALFDVGEVVTITAEASDADGTVDNVEFFVDGVSVGVATDAPYSLDWSATAGERVLTAVATDNDGAETTSEPVSIQVGTAVASTVCDYTIANEWNAGFVVNIRVTNNSAEPVDGWEVIWEYTQGETVSNGWSAQIAGDNPYTATPMSWNRVIQPGQYVEFGFQAAKGSAGTPGSVPVLGGDSCEN